MSGPRPLLVHVTTTDISLELLLGPQLEAFREAGYEVIGLSASGPYEADLARRGIRHVALLHATRAMDPFADLRLCWELIQRFRSLRPTIVHTHNPKPGVFGRVAARLTGVPVIVNTVHGLYALPDDPFATRAVVYSLERIAAACSDAELLQNPEDLPVLRRLRVPADRLAVLGNGIDLTRFDPATVDDAERAAARAELGATSPDDVIVGLVGRLVREKGFPEVFEAARRLRADHPRIRFAIIGPADPDKAGSLTRAELDAAEADGVTLLGERHDLPTLYRAMDLFVLASHREGFPRAAMEAAAMGVPVIATDIRGCRQVVDPGRNGVLVPLRDPAALADAIVQLADDPARRAALAEGGIAKAARDFDQQTSIDLTLDTYRRLLAENGRQAPTPRTARPAPAVAPSVRPAVAADAATLAHLHAEAIPEGFLPMLGRRFLVHLYRRIIADPDSFALVAEDAHGIAGFIAASQDTGTLYRRFARHDGLRAGLAAAPHLIRHPRRVWETWRYGAGADHADLPDAEVLATAVAPRAQGAGHGRRLVAAAVHEFQERGISEALVVTAEANDAARQLYEGAGFVANGSVEVHPGVRQTVLVWR